MPGDLTLPEAVQLAAEAARNEVRVARTARITRVHDSGQIDIQPDVAERSTVRGEVVWELPPEVPKRTVLWFGGSGAGLFGRPRVGDRVIALVRDVDHGDDDSGNEQDRPTSSRRFDWSDAVCLGGFFRPADGAPDNALPSSDSDLVAYMKGGGVLYIGDTTAVELLCRADKVLTELSKIETSFTSAVAPTGGGALTWVPPTAKYTAPLSSSAIASDRIKVDS